MFAPYPAVNCWAIVIRPLSRTKASKDFLCIAYLIKFNPFEQEHKSLSSPYSVRIEPATERDIPLILEFVRGLAEYEKHLDRLETTEERIRKTIFSAEPAARVVFAYLDDVAVGFAVCFQTYSTFAGLPGLYLEDLFVKPEARGKGVGRELLRYLARLAKEQGYSRIEWAVLHWNEPAIGFYKRLGAVSMDEWDVYRLSGTELDRLAETD